MTYFTPIIYKNGKHEPMDVNVDKLSADTLPVAPFAGNQLRVVQQGNIVGLYVGSGAVPPVLYVSSASGVDAPGRGTSTADPFQTVHYAIQALRAGYVGAMPPVEGTSVPEVAVIPTDIVIALKAGEIFPVTNSYQFTGQIVFTYYGDANYGDFNTIVGGKAFGVTMTDLARPQLNPVVDPSSANGIMHFKGLNNMVGSRTPTLTLLGVTVNLPAGAASNSDYQDLLTVEAERECRLQLIGARVNKLDTTNQYGAVGIHSRGRAIIEQYASQFLVQGLQVQSGAANDALLARPSFIKFYPERLGNSQLNGTLNAGYAPTGMLTVQWSNCNAELVIPGKTAQVTYPQVGDPSFGLAAYFTNLLRDPQARPLNCICPALL